MQQLISEVKIISPSINAQNELIFRCRVQASDWTQELKDFIYNLNATGNTVAMAIVQIEDKPPEDLLPKLRQQLALVMQEYCEVSTEKMDTLLERLYKLYKVTSRTELTEEQLRTQIESYRYGIMEYNK